jgi:predicted transcriptional regulator
MGELEDAVMTRVWKWNRPVTVREVLEDLQRDRSIAYTTVMTVLDNLHQKGWVRREAEGRAYRYEAVSTRAAYAAALMNEAWSHSDNPAAALVAFFGMMSPRQREALRDAVHIVQVHESPAPGENVEGAAVGNAEGAGKPEEPEQLHASEKTWNPARPEKRENGEEGETARRHENPPPSGKAAPQNPGALHGEPGR